MHATGEGDGHKRETLAGRHTANLLRRFAKGVAGIRRPTSADIRLWLKTEAETEAKARSAFFLVPIGLMIGVAIVDGAGFRIGLLPASALALPLLALAWRLGGRGVAGLLTLLLAFSAGGMALAEAELRLTRTTIFSGEATTRIEGRVIWRDRDDRNRMRYLVRIDRTERPVLSRPPEIAAILVTSRHDPIPVGGRFAGLVRLRAPSGPAYPGAYDFAFAPFFEGRGANGFSLGAPEPPSSEPVTPGIGERLISLRLAMSDRIREVIPGGAGAVASALITGERSGIPDDIDQALRVTGLSHVLSISGLHMALVAGFAMVLVRGCLAAIPGAALVLPTKKIAAVAALIVATGYLVISGSDVATDRSYVMLAIMLAAILADRPALTLRNVGIAAVVVILTTPHAVVTASFQMSFAATMALIGVYGALSKRAHSKEGTKRRHPIFPLILFLAGLAASSAIAGAATAPYAAYHFQRIAPYGVIANLVAVPIFSFWIMPLSLIAVLVMPFGLDALFLVPIGWGLELVFALAKFLAASLPDAPSGRLTAIGLVTITVALLLACLPAGRLRWVAVPATILGLILLPDHSARPDLLIFEDGRELATIDSGGNLRSLRRRPNDFVLGQWQRVFAGKAEESEEASNASEMPRSMGDEPSPPVEIAYGPSKLLESSNAQRSRQTGGATTVVSNNSLIAEGFVCTDSPLPPEDRKGSTGDTSQEASSRSLGPNHPVRPSAPIPFEPDGPKRVSDTSQTETKAQLPLDELDASRSVSEAETARPTDPSPSSSKKPSRKPLPPRQVCRATTRNGLRIAWTDDYRLTGTVCDSADIAIVARAIALEQCRSGAQLVTLRTLRKSGSLAIYRATSSDRPRIEPSIDDPDAPWNLHRRAAWPESWRNPDQSKQSKDMHTPKPAGP